MERELWEGLCGLLRGVYKLGGPARYGPGTGDDVILAVFWWSVVHERPVSWSCVAENWPPDLRRLPLPSQPTMSRRLRSRSVELLMHRFEQQLITLTGSAQSWVWMIDGKPLPVGGASKDSDAAWGRGSGGVQKGYKLHAVWGGGALPVAWSLTPLNRNEQVVAEELLPTLPGGGYVLGDKQYDGNKLYDAAAESGCQLVAPPSGKGGSGTGATARTGSGLASCSQPTSAPPSTGGASRLNAGSLGSLASWAASGRSPSGCVASTASALGCKANSSSTPSGSSVYTPS